MRIRDLVSPVAPTREHLDLALLRSHRLADGGPFPSSYVEFVEHAGWARLFGLYLVYPPVLPSHADGWARAEDLTCFVRENYAESRADEFDWVIEPDGSWEMIPHLVVFGIGENGEHLLWDSRTRDPRGEYGVWLSNRGSSLEFLGTDLADALNALRARSPLSASAPDLEPLPATG